jgi:hypothetical protein
MTEHSASPDARVDDWWLNPWRVQGRLQSESEVDKAKIKELTTERDEAANKVRPPLLQSLPPWSLAFL